MENDKIINEALNVAHKIHEYSYEIEDHKRMCKQYLTYWKAINGIMPSTKWQEINFNSELNYKLNMDTCRYIGVE